MDTRLLLVAAVVVAALVLLAVIAFVVRRRRRGRLRAAEQRHEAEIRRVTAEQRAADDHAEADHGSGHRDGADRDGADRENAAEQLPAADPPAESDRQTVHARHAASDRGATAAPDAPTPPSGERGTPGAVAVESELRTERLPVDGGDGRPGEADPAAPTGAIPVVDQAPPAGPSTSPHHLPDLPRRHARPNADGQPAAEQDGPHRHRRPDDVTAPPLIAAVAERGGGRHRAEPDDVPPTPADDHQPTEPRGEPVVPERPRVEPGPDGQFGIPRFDLPRQNDALVEAAPAAASARPPDNSTDLTAVIPAARSGHDGGPEGDGGEPPPRRRLADRLRGRNR